MGLSCAASIPCTLFLHNCSEQDGRRSLQPTLKPPVVHDSNWPTAELGEYPVSGTLL